MERFIGTFQQFFVCWGGYLKSSMERFIGLFLYFLQFATEI